MNKQTCFLQNEIKINLKKITIVEAFLEINIFPTLLVKVLGDHAGNPFPLLSSPRMWWLWRDTKLQLSKLFDTPQLITKRMGIYCPSTNVTPDKATESNKCLIDFHAERSLSCKLKINVTNFKKEQDIISVLSFQYDNLNALKFTHF